MHSSGVILENDTLEGLQEMCWRFSVLLAGY